jgi:hypothetical protein
MTTEEGAPPTKIRLRNAATVFATGLLLGPSIGALAFSIYRAVATHWGISALQGERLLVVIYLAYIFTVVPALLASARLAWRTWRTGGFGYLAAALTASLCMLAYLGAAAIIFKNERVRVLDWEIAGVAVILAGCASLACTWLLRWARIITRGPS